MSRKDTLNENSYCFEDGDVIEYSEGDIKVESLIGDGGQGAVYKVYFKGKKFAFKVTKKNGNTSASISQIKALTDLKHAPENNPSFIWPLYYVESDDFYGYMMDLVPSGFESLNDYFENKVEITAEVMVKICLNICLAFHDLHIHGFTYKDISTNNIMFDPKNGNIAIYDNDNVSKSGEKTCVMGTPRFIAPEIVMNLGTMGTYGVDSYSLAVLLFMILMNGIHPLEGDFQNLTSMDFDDDREFDKKIYGYDALYIFSDVKNYTKNIKTFDCAKDVVRLWLSYPTYLREMFLKTFTLGIKSGHERPKDTEWIHAFTRLLAGLYTCPYCGNCAFYDYDLLKDLSPEEKISPKCPNCSKYVKLPFLKVKSVKSFDGINSINQSVYFILHDGEELPYRLFLFSSDPTCMNTFLKVEYKNQKIRFYNNSNFNVSICPASIHHAQNYINDIDVVYPGTWSKQIYIGQWPNYNEKVSGSTHQKFLIKYGNNKEGHIGVLQ